MEVDKHMHRTFMCVYVCMYVYVFMCVYVWTLYVFFVVYMHVSFLVFVYVCVRKCGNKACLMEVDEHMRRTLYIFLVVCACAC